MKDPNQLANQLDMPHTMIQDLLRCAGTEIVVIADDSGSMTVGNRWMELQQSLSSLLQLLLAIDDGGGFELRFLNHQPPAGMGLQDGSVRIHSMADLNQCWQWASPNGRTPLGAHCRHYLSAHSLPNGQKRLLMIFTDGEPSDVNFNQLQQIIRSKNHKQMFVSCMMCTDEDCVVEQYNRYIDPIPGVDVNDDYKSEKKEVKKKMRKNLSVNEYLGKCVLGPMMKKYDNMDGKSKDAGCCVLL